MTRVVIDPRSRRARRLAPYLRGKGFDVREGSRAAAGDLFIVDLSVDGTNPEEVFHGLCRLDPCASLILLAERAGALVEAGARLLGATLLEGPLDPGAVLRAVRDALGRCAAKRDADAPRRDVAAVVALGHHRANARARHRSHASPRQREAE